MELKKTSKSDLQNKKTLFLEFGLSFSLLVVLVAFNWSSREKRTSLLVAPSQEIIEEEEHVPITQPDTPAPPEIPKIPQIPEIIDIVDDDVNILSNFDFSESEKNNLFNDYLPINGTQPELKDMEDIDEIIPFIIVEEKPMFQGKNADEFAKWIYSQLAGNYPEEALANNIQGVVRISFIVNTDGTLSDIRSIKKTDPLLENCVIEIVKKSPKWTPGRQQNKPVKVPYQVPIVFKIQQ
jgi:protein TonB